MKRKGGDVFMMKIFIDPGHGGRDPGATANGLQEKMICLQIAQKLNHILMETYNSVQTRLSRTTDQTLSLKARTDMANRWGADYLISIHVNRSEEHTSELQSRGHLVCRLLLEKK